MPDYVVTSFGFWKDHDIYGLSINESIIERLRKADRDPDYYNLAKLRVAFMGEVSYNLPVRLNLHTETEEFVGPIFDQDREWDRKVDIGEVISLVDVDTIADRCRTVHISEVHKSYFSKDMPVTVRVVAGKDVDAGDYQGFVHLVRPEHLIIRVPDWRYIAANRVDADGLWFQDVNFVPCAEPPQMPVSEPETPGGDEPAGEGVKAPEAAVEAPDEATKEAEDKSVKEIPDLDL